MLSILWAYLITEISKYIPGQNLNEIQQIDPKYNQLTVFITVVIIGPVIETFFFQYLLIKGVTKIFKWSLLSYQTALVSILAFGLMHTYNILMVIATIIGGFFLYICYALFELKNKNAFVFTLLLHSIYNFYGWFIDFI